MLLTFVLHLDKATASFNAAPAPTMTQAAYTLATIDQFVLFGDSITQQCFSQNSTFAFGAALADTYARKLDVVNRGLSGYNTMQALRALPLCIPKPEQAKVRFLLIFFGMNDARIRGSPGGPDQSTSVDEYRRYIRYMANHPSVRAHKDVRIILVTTPPIDERKALLADQEKYPDLCPVLRRAAISTAIYAQAMRTLGQELGIPVLDIYTAMLARSGHGRETTPIPGSLEAPKNPTLQSYLTDGLHFSGEGYRLLFGQLMALIERTWSDQMPARIPIRLPLWDLEPSWKVDGDRNPPPWQDSDAVVVTGILEALLSDLQRVT